MVTSPTPPESTEPKGGAGETRLLPFCAVKANRLPLVKRQLPTIIVIGALTAVFANLLQKRLASSNQPTEEWEPVSLA